MTAPLTALSLALEYGDRDRVVALTSVASMLNEGLLPGMRVVGPVERARALAGVIP